MFAGTVPPSGDTRMNGRCGKVMLQFRWIFGKREKKSYKLRRLGAALSARCKAAQKWDEARRGEAGRGGAADGNKPPRRVCPCREQRAAFWANYVPTSRTARRRRKRCTFAQIDARAPVRFASRGLPTSACSFVGSRHANKRLRSTKPYHTQTLFINIKWTAQKMRYNSLRQLQNLS